MIRSSTFAGKRVAVFGLGSSGNTAALSLMAGGADVAAWDDGEAGRASAARALIPLVDLRTADWRTFAALVLAPGVPLTHPEPHWTVVKAKAEGVEIIGDVELFCRERAATCPDAPFIAITGTNGKSTTTALVAHILREAGRDVQMGGNIGIPILALEPPAPNRFHVIEMSSFQIDLTPGLSPTVGVLLNITPDHLDRHGSIENYAAVKARLVANASRAVVGIDEAWSRRIALELGASGRAPVTISVDGHADIFAADGGLSTGTVPQVRFDLTGIGSLRGAHNAQNAAAAIAALSPYLGADVISVGMRSFPGLAHRMERLGHIETAAGRVLVVNDSKATNAGSTEKALLSYPSDVFWIVGGKPKDGGIESLRPYFGGVVRAYLIGASSDEFSRTLDGDVAIIPCGTIDVAIGRAAADTAAYLAGSEMAQWSAAGDSQRTKASPAAAASEGQRRAMTPTLPEPVILFSPACASFDQFQNFEKRGDAFRALVAALPGFVGPGVPTSANPGLGEP